MAFNLCPDTGPPRLIRFTSLPGTTISTLDKENNLLRVDREKFDQLSKEDRETIIRTDAAEITLESRLPAW